MSFGSFESSRGTGNSATLSEINMVPLIDVMLVLLVIFMITAPLLSHSLQISLPKASTAPVEQEPAVIDIAIDDQGRLYWNEEAIAPSELMARMKAEADQDQQPTLRLRADKETRYERLAEIMADAKKAGLTKMGFITHPDS
ncbi:MAG TPA: biopolymer transporter ExbD [Burkholderiaceae bacterium]|nr:biopolymer transporter ExbD [Burkholderiaceae bacterium]